MHSYFTEVFTDFGIKEFEKRGHKVSTEERRRIREGMKHAIKNNAELQTALLDFIDDCIDKGVIKIKYSSLNFPGN
jgi:hypothetical protein